MDRMARSLRWVVCHGNILIYIYVYIYITIILSWELEPKTHGSMRISWDLGI
jgi:hypothetical protein